MTTPPFPGSKWTPDEIAAGLIRHGFTGWQVVTMGAICYPESGGYVWAHGLNHSKPSSAANLSEDHGLYMINDYWGPQVLSAELLDRLRRGSASFSQLAKDPEWNLAAAREMFLLGTLQRGYAQAYNVWNAHAAGRHQPYVAASRAAAVRQGAVL